ncbi:MAG: helix-turn-helix domain-containing protein [Actinomycetia bacterium]|nr:helix-turn-helix domain-containing protein [Actinomycetes bacterium]
MAWLTPRQAARLLHVREATVYAWCREDPDFPAVQVSEHRWRIAESQLEAWAAKRRAREFAAKEAATP